MQSKTFVLAALGFAALTGSSAVFATETVTYTYDVRGRLIRVVHTGSVNNNIQACYKLDKVDNRTNVTTNTTASSLPACPT